jgi:WD40-like Beta Propeller Repeat
VIRWACVLASFAIAATASAHPGIEGTAATPSGRIAVGNTPGLDGILILAASDGRVLTRIPERAVAEVDLSLDGSRIAYPTYPRPAGLVVQRVSGGPRRVVARCSEKWCPNWATWSRGDSELAYEQGGVIYTVFANGLGRARVTRGETPDFSPRTPEIAFVRDYSYDTNAGKILVAARDGHDVRYVTRGAYPAFHPSGRKLAFVLRRDIYTVPVAGGNVLRLIRNGASPVWSPDGRFIAFTRFTSCPKGGHGPCSGRIFIAPATSSRRAHPIGPEIADIGRISWSR